jgi:hypothetical protein
MSNNNKQASIGKILPWDLKQDTFTAEQVCANYFYNLIIYGMAFTKNHEWNKGSCNNKSRTKKSIVVAADVVMGCII